MSIMSHGPPAVHRRKRIPDHARPGRTSPRPPHGLSRMTRATPLAATAVGALPPPAAEGRGPAALAPHGMAPDRGQKRARRAQLRTASGGPETGALPGDGMLT